MQAVRRRSCNAANTSAPATRSSTTASGFLTATREPARDQAHVADVGATAECFEQAAAESDGAASCRQTALSARRGCRPPADRRSDRRRPAAYPPTDARHRARPGACSAASSTAFWSRRRGANASCRHRPRRDSRRRRARAPSRRAAGVACRHRGDAHRLFRLRGPASSDRTHDGEAEHAVIERRSTRARSAAAPRPRRRRS